MSSAIRQHIIPLPAGVHLDPDHLNPCFNRKFKAFDVYIQEKLRASDEAINHAFLIHKIYCLSVFIFSNLVTSFFTKNFKYTIIISFLLTGCYHFASNSRLNVHIKTIRHIALRETSSLRTQTYLQFKQMSGSNLISYIESANTFLSTEIHGAMKAHHVSDDYAKSINSILVRYFAKDSNWRHVTPEGSEYYMKKLNSPSYLLKQAYYIHLIRNPHDTHEFQDFFELNQKTATVTFKRLSYSYSFQQISNLANQDPVIRHLADCFDSDFRHRHKK